MEIIVVAVGLLIVITALDAKLWPKSKKRGVGHTRSARPKALDRGKTRQSRGRHSPIGFYGHSQQGLSLVRSPRR